MNGRWRQFVSARLPRQASRWALSALVLTACSCSAVQRPLAGSAADPFLDGETPAGAASVVATETRHRVARQDVVLAGHETDDRSRALPKRDPAVIPNIAMLMEKNAR